MANRKPSTNGKSRSEARYNGESVKTRPGFTPTQQRILALLSDGLPHTRTEIHECLDDELSGLSNVRAHLCLLRRVLRPIGEDITCEYSYGTFRFRHVRLLASAYDGRK